MTTENISQYDVYDRAAKYAMQRALELGDGVLLRSIKTLMDAAKTVSTHVLVVCVDSVDLGFGSPSMEVLLFPSEKSAVNFAVDRLVRYRLYDSITGGRFINLSGSHETFANKKEVLDDFDAALESGERFRVIQVREQTS